MVVRDFSNHFEFKMQYMRKMMSHVPDTWSAEFVYEDKRYILVDVEEGCEEYQEVVKQFTETRADVATPASEDRVTYRFTVQRVQHPFAFARYQLHKEALVKKKEKFTVDTIYVQVLEDDLSMYLDYSCDQRRIPRSIPVNLSGIQPPCVRQQLIKDNYFNKRDSNTYPEYVIKLKLIQTEQEVPEQSEQGDPEQTKQEELVETEPGNREQTQQDEPKQVELENPQQTQQDETKQAEPGTPQQTQPDEPKQEVPVESE